MITSALRGIHQQPDDDLVRGFPAGTRLPKRKGDAARSDNVARHLRGDLQVRYM